MTAMVLYGETHVTSGNFTRCLRSKLPLAARCFLKIFNESQLDINLPGIYYILYIYISSIIIQSELSQAVVMILVYLRNPKRNCQTS